MNHIPRIRGAGGKKVIAKKEKKRLPPTPIFAAFVDPPGIWPVDLSIRLEDPHYSREMMRTLLHFNPSALIS